MLVNYVIKAINSWAVSLLWYSGGIVNWTKSELAELDRKTRKLFTIHGALHPRSNVSRLYLPRREGGRGLISVEDARNTEERNIYVYISQSQEHLLKATWKRKNVDEIETPKEYKERMKTGKELRTGLESSCMGSLRGRLRSYLVFPGIG